MSHSPPRIRSRTDESGIFVVRKITIRKVPRRPAPTSPRPLEVAEQAEPRSYRPMMISLVLASAAWLLVCALWAFN